MTPSAGGIGGVRVDIRGDFSKLKGDMEDAQRVVTGTLKGFDLGAIGAGLTKGLTLPLLALGAAALKVAADFDDAFDNIRAATGATGPALESLSGSFREVFATVPANAKQASDAIADLNVRLGLTGAPLEEMSTQMLNLARVTGTEVAPLIAATTRVFGDWSISTDKQASTLDFLFRVTQSTGIGIEQLSAKVVQFGAPLRQMGFSLEQSAALLGKFEKEGVNAELVMGSLRIALTRMAKEGVTDSAAALKVLSEQIKNAGTSGEANALALETFGARAGPDMAAAIREGRFEIDGLLSTLRGSGETINKAAADTLSLSERITLLGNKARLALEPLGVALVGAIEKLLTAARPLIDVLTSAMQSFGALDPNIQMLIIGLAAAAAAIGPVLQAVSALSGLLAGGAGLAGLLAAAGPLAIAFGVAIAAWAIATAVMEVRKLNAEMERLQETLKRGAAANKEQAQTIKVLESAIASHNKQIGAQRIAVESTGKSVAEYIDALKAAVKENGLAAFAIEKTGKAAATTAGHTDAVAESSKGLTAAVEKAERAYKAALRAYDAGKISLEKLGAAQAAFIRAQDAADPERAAKRHETAYFDMLDRYEDMATGILAAAEKLKKADDDLATSARDLSADLGKAHKRISDKAAKTVAIVVPLNKRLPEGLQTAITELGRVAAAYERLGITAPKVLAQTIEDNRKAWETISGDAGSQSVAALEAWIKYETSRQDAARRSGEVIPESQRRALEKAQGQLDGALGKQKSAWDTFAKQVSTIISDLGKSITDRLFKAFSGEFNRGLDEQAAKLRESLASRTTDWEKYKADAGTQLEKLREKHGAELEKEEEQLAKSLDAERGQYEEYVADVGMKLIGLREESARGLEKELDQLAATLRDKEGAYEEYVSGVGDKEQEIRSNHAERLADELSDLQDSLRDRVEAYTEFVEDANRKLRRIGEDLQEDIRDQTRATNRKLEDENDDFARDTIKLNEEIDKAEKKGDTERVRELKRSLGDRERDHHKTIRRLNEDLEEHNRDARRKAEEQTADAKLQLERRTADHGEFLAGIRTKEVQARADHAKDEATELGELQTQLGRRTQELIAFRTATSTAMGEARQEAATALTTQTRDLNDSLRERTTRWETYQRDAADQLILLRGTHGIQLAAEEAALFASLEEQRKQYEKFVNDPTTGILAQLKTIEEAHKSTWDNIREVLTGTLTDMAQAIARFGTEALVNGLFKQLKELVEEILPGVGKKLGQVFGGGASIPGVGGGGGGTAPGVPGDMGPVTGGGGGGVADVASSALTTSVTGLINVVTGVVTAVASVISAVYDIRQEGTLNQIERNTAAASIHLKNILEKANEFWPFARDTQTMIAGTVVGVLREIRDGLKTLFTVNLNLTGEEERRLVSSLITRVGTFDTLATDRLLDINTSIASLATATQDLRKGVVDAVNASAGQIASAVARVENKLPGTLEKILGGGGGLLGLAGGLPAALGGFLAGLLGGGGKAEDRTEENTRYTAGALLGPDGVVSTLRDYLPNLKFMRDDYFATTVPWMAEVSDLMRDGIVDQLREMNATLTLGTNPLLTSIDAALAGDGARDVHIHLEGAVFARREDIDYMVDQISRNLR